MPDNTEFMEELLKRPAPDPLRSALVAIQEQHEPEELPVRLDEFGRWVTEKCCSMCTHLSPPSTRVLHPCATRKLADEGLGGGQDG